jgi:hypothetical protein
MPIPNVSLYSQILKLIDRTLVERLVKRHQSDKHSKGLDTWTHLVSMLFCHLAKSTSVREISDGLRSAAGNLNHLGVERSPSKSSVSYINQHRTWEVFRDLYFELLEKLEPSVGRKRKYAHRLKRKIFLMDATIITVSLGLFDWAAYRKRKGAVKLHTVLDYDTALPAFVHLTDARTHEIHGVPEGLFTKGSVVVMDRGYLKFSYLNDLDSSGVWFVTRLKRNTDTEVLQTFMTDDRHEHILSDEEIKLVSLRGLEDYKGRLRLVQVYDQQTDKYLMVITNNLSWTADTISQLYRSRWDIEVFFKQIKQILRIKAFVGTSPNAVLIQVWTAMIAILLLTYLKNQVRHKWHLSNLAAMIRTHLFSKIDLLGWLNEPFYKSNPPPQRMPLLELLD